MPIVTRSFNTIVNSLREKMTANVPELDTSEGKYFRISVVDPVALEIESIEDLLLQVQESQYLLTAQGADLDLLAYNYNVYRRGAQKASGFVQFYIAQSDLTDPITIPKGTTVRSTGGVEYETLLEGILNGFAQQSTRNSVPTYEITLPISAKSTGSTGNASANTLTTVIGLSDLNVTNDSIIEGGFEEEPDSSLASRAILSFGIWSRGVKAAVEFGAREVPGVWYASAVYAYAGHFNLYVSDQAGLLSDEMRAAIELKMIEWASSGVGWTILAPPIFLLNVNVRVIFKNSENASAQINTFRSDIAGVINATQESSLYIDDFITAVKSKTSSYVQNFDIDSPLNHTIRPAGEIIRSGTITVTNETT